MKKIQEIKSSSQKTDGLTILDLDACSYAFESIEMPKKIQEKLVDFEKRDGVSSAAEPMLQFTRTYLDVFRQYIRKISNKKAAIDRGEHNSKSDCDQAIIKLEAYISHLKNLQVYKILKESNQCGSVSGSVSVSDEELQQTDYDHNKT
ncbi:hypothetical protein ACTFIR_003960 [Dictyostelium discoideum]